MKKLAKKIVAAKKAVATKSTPVKEQEKTKTPAKEIAKSSPAKAQEKKTRGRHPGPEPKEGWPKHQAWALYQKTQDDAAVKKLCDDLEVANHRSDRWLREFPVKLKAMNKAAPPKTPAKEEAKAPAKKTTAKKAVAKKMAVKKAA